MALKSVLDNVDDLPDSVKTEYKEVKRGDKTVFVLDVENPDALPAVASLKSAFERNKEDLKTTKTSLQALQSRVEGMPEDFDGDAYNEMKSIADKSIKPEDLEAQRTAVRESLQKKHDGVVKEKDDRIGKLEGSMKRMVVGNGLTEALIAAGIGREFIDATRALIASKRVIEVKEDDEGNFTPGVKTDLGEFTLAQYVTTWADSDEGKPFVAKGRGAGSKNDGGDPSRMSGNPFAKDTFNRTEQQNLLVKNPEKARQLAKAAGVELPQGV